MFRSEIQLFVIVIINQSHGHLERDVTDVVPVWHTTRIQQSKVLIVEMVASFFL